MFYLLNLKRLRCGPIVNSRERIIVLRFGICLKLPRFFGCGLWLIFFSARECCHVPVLERGIWWEPAHVMRSCNAQQLSGRFAQTAVTCESDRDSHVRRERQLSAKIRLWQKSAHRTLMPRHSFLRIQAQATGIQWWPCQLRVTAEPCANLLFFGGQTWSPRKIRENGDGESGGDVSYSAPWRATRVQYDTIRYDTTQVYMYTYIV